MDADADGLLTLPNVSLPLGQASQGPAGFGPIPSAWPARQKLRGSLSWSDANQSLDVEVPDDFDDAYFQTAPADQRVADLRAGDLFALVNMHPEHGTLRTFLPATQGVALPTAKRACRPARTTAPRARRDARGNRLPRRDGPVQ
jgi:hypothetical protein